VGVLAVLLELQAIDTTIDQMRHRLSNLPETKNVEDAVGRQRGIDTQLRHAQTEAARLTSEISAGESRTQEIRQHLERLNRQMKTIIAPREAEALQHEIDILRSETSDIDDRGLAAMDELGTVESRIVELEKALDVAGGEVESARAAESATTTETRAAIDAQRLLRDAAAGDVSAVVLASYDTKRTQLAGVAVAQLSGLSCRGCHLDISRSEADQLGKMPEDERECPNCSRWLVL